MHALLVNPWITDFAAYDLWARPLGLLTIAAWLKDQGYTVSLIDCRDRFHPRLNEWLGDKLPARPQHGAGQYYYETIPKPGLYASVPRRYKRYGFPVGLFDAMLSEHGAVDVILVTSGMTYWYPGAFEAIALLKKRFARTPLVLGGIYARLCTAHARAFSGADAVCSGNNRQEIMRLISSLTGRRLRPPRQDVFFPSYELYPELASLTVRASSGCPFRCSYCGWYALEKEFTRADAGWIVGQIERYYRERGVSHFAFYDDSFLYDASHHALPILRALIDRDLDARFYLPNGLNVRFLDRESAGLLKAAGFTGLRLGWEGSSGRHAAKATAEELLAAVRFLREAGFSDGEIAVNVLIGLPQQDLEEVKQSVAFAAQAGLLVNLEEYSPVPGSRDYARSGLANDADPLLHNNNLYYGARAGIYRQVQEIKDMVHEHNEGIRKA